MHRRLSRFAWGVLVWNLAVILWGAYVRATGSGAGCGAHWPLCNGEMVPRAPSLEMLVEFSHRITSGLALVSVMVLFVWTWRSASASPAARKAAAWSAFFMVTEAAVGAMLVLFRLVADNATMARAMFMAVHLMNTFALLAAMTLTAWWLSDKPAITFSGASRGHRWVALGAVALFVVGVSGAVAALGDTLYPAQSLASGLAQDLSSGSILMIRLRVWHPLLAVLAGAGLITAGNRLRGSADADTATWGRLLALGAGTQLAAGFVNVLLLAPVWMQLVHLLLADLVWTAFILASASVLADRRTAGPLSA